MALNRIDATLVGVTPVGTISATNLQAAISEIDSEKISTVGTANISPGAVTPEKLATDSFFAHGQCRLIKSGANLLLTPFNGNRLVINGSVKIIPAAGVSLAPPATNNTTYYIYAYMNGSTMELEASVTGSATDSTTGVVIKSGDATRTLVGMARTVSSAWVDSASQRFVISWFNKRIISAQKGLGSNTSSSSSSFVLLSSDIAEFICWGDGNVNYNVTGSCTLSTGSQMQTVVWRDGVALTPGIVVSFGSTATNLWPAIADCNLHESAGYHYAGIGVAVNGSGTWYGGGYTKVSAIFEG